MKVVQINAVYEFGSTGRICKEISEFLNQKNIENYVFFGGGNNETQIAKRVSNNIDTKLHAFLSRLTGKQGYFSYFYTKRLVLKLKKIKPDIVHLHNLHNNFINFNVLMKYLIKNDIPTAITLHDCWFYTGKCTHYTADGCYKWIDECNNCKRLKKDNSSWFFDKTKEMWNDKKKNFENIKKLAVIGVSDWITNEAKKSYLKNAKIIERIYNWIDTDVYIKKENVREKYNISDDDFVILLIGGSWSENSAKYQDVIRLCQKLDKDVKVLMAGNAKEDIKLPQNIIKLGYINSEEELANIYSMSDCYVHLSREDTFGKVVAEAMSCGTPVIVYNTTALPELVGKNCGYVVDIGDIDQIVDKINIIRTDGKERYEDCCREYIKRNFEKNMLLEKTLDLYKRDIGEE